MININKQQQRMGNVVSRDTTPFSCYARSKEIYEFVIPVIGPIEYNHDFLEAVATIEQAEAKDTVILKVNSPGGSLAAIDYLVQALAQTEAHVHADVSGELMSAATLIMEYVDSFNISDNTYVLIHNSVFGDYGKTKDVVDAVLFADKMNKKFLDRYYKHMFTDDEMSQLYAGRQFFMDNTEYLERFQKRAATLALLEQENLNEGEENLTEEQTIEEIPNKCSGTCSCNSTDCQSED